MQRLTIWTTPNDRTEWTVYGQATLNKGRVVVSGFANLLDVEEVGIAVGNMGGPFVVRPEDGELFLQALAWFYRAYPRTPKRAEAEGFTINDDAALTRRLKAREGQIAGSGT